MQVLVRKAVAGAKVIVIPGNHDEFLKAYLGIQLGNVEIVSEAIFVSKIGKKFWVTHGDQFDIIVQNAKWLALIGDVGYTLAIWSNRWINIIRRLLGRKDWSLSFWVKMKVKNAVNFISNFEKILAHAAVRHKADGVICGHIHFLSIKPICGILYCNCGDWVESCSAIFEDNDGQLRMMNWPFITP